MKCIVGQGEMLADKGARRGILGPIAECLYILPVIGALLLLLAFSPQSTEAQSIKVGSYNVRVETPDDGVNNWPNRKGNVVTLLQTTYPLDIFGLQEDSNSHVTYIDNNMSGFDYVGRGANASPTSGEYCAIFYRTARFQLLEPAQTRWLSTTPTVAGSKSWGALYPRVVTQAKLKDLQTNVEFWVFNTHFEHWESPTQTGETARNNSALLLKQWTNDVGNYPVVVIGDFNTQPNTTAINTILSTPVLDTKGLSQSGHQGDTNTAGVNGTWTAMAGGSNSWIIDYIFVKNGTTVLDHRHATDKYDLAVEPGTILHFPSDHLPVITTVILPVPTGGTETVTLKNGTGTYNGNVTFHVSGQNAAVHYGPSDYKHLANSISGSNNYVYRPFYKFDLSSSASGIPANAVITSATLQLKVEWSSGAANLNVYRVKPVNNAFSVNYSTATRNTYNGSTGWTGGANAAGDVANPNNDFLDTPDSTAPLPAGGAAGTLAFDVTSSVQAWVNGEANNGWLVFPSAYTAHLGTSADLQGPADLPVLTVTYESTPPSTTKLLKNGHEGYTGATSLHVSGQSPSTYAGPSNYYHIANTSTATNGFMFRTFYKFDVSPTASGIPSGATIESARLRMKVEPSSSTTGYGVSVYRVAPVGGAFTVNYAAATKNSYNGTAATGPAGRMPAATSPTATTTSSTHPLPPSRRSRRLGSGLTST